MIAAFNHKFGTGYVGPSLTGHGQVLIVAALIKSSDPKWLELENDAKKFAKENKIEHTQIIEQS